MREHMMGVIESNKKLYTKCIKITKQDEIYLLSGIFHLSELNLIHTGGQL